MDFYRKIPLDPEKRYLVFGDIHGRYATFSALLEQVGHDPATDIVCSVGDLIDRGPESIAVVDFFRREHCHVVRGNHEQMVVDSDEWRDIWLDPRNGGATTLASIERCDRDLPWLRAFCTSLPVCLDVGEDDEPGAFRLIHAESPFDWPESHLQDFLSEATSDELSSSRLLWGRDDIELGLRRAWMPWRRRAVRVDPQRSTRPVFCGHTPVPETVEAFGTRWIDTSAGGFLTCVEPPTMREHRMDIADSDRY